MNGVSGAYSAHCPWTHLLQTLIRRLRFDRGAAAGAAHLDFFGSNHHVDVTHLLVQVAQQLLKQAFFCDFFFFFFSVSEGGGVIDWSRQPHHFAMKPVQPVMKTCLWAKKELITTTMSAFVRFDVQVTAVALRKERSDAAVRRVYELHVTHAPSGAAWRTHCSVDAIRGVGEFVCLFVCLFVSHSFGWSQRLALRGSTVRRTARSMR